jgi:hypothetical protein
MSASIRPVSASIWRVRVRAMSASTMTRTETASSRLATLVTLIRESSRSFSSRLIVPGTFPHEVGAHPGVVTQGTDRCRRYERRAQHALLGESGQPHRVELVRWSAITGYRVTRQQLDWQAVGGPVVANFRASSRYTIYKAPRCTLAGTRSRFAVQSVNALGTGTARSAIGSVR